MREYGKPETILTGKGLEMGRLLTMRSYSKDIICMAGL
jgi:hypothetical protein